MTGRGEASASLLKSIRVISAMLVEGSVRQALALMQ